MQTYAIYQNNSKINKLFINCNPISNSTYILRDDD